MRHPSLFFLYSSVTRMKGIGGATAAALQRLLPPSMQLDGRAMPTVRDLLFHLPIGMVDRRFTCPLTSAPNGVVATFVVTVQSHHPPRRHVKAPYKIICVNETGDITLVFFHAQADYLKKLLPIGSKRVISGRTEHFDYRLQMTHPDIIAPAEQLAEVQKPEAVYPLTVGITSRRISKIIEDALKQLPELPEWIDRSAFSHWPGWKAALQAVHHPQSPEDLLPESPARQRLAYDEILANQLYLGLLRSRMQQQAGEIIHGTCALTEALLAALPFQLTAGQHKVLEEINADMASGRRMGRLLQGDVGSGKTIVALLAMLRAVEQGRQAALMAPTEIIARQHYETISKLLMSLRAQRSNPDWIATSAAPPRDDKGEKGDIEVALLTGSIKGQAREAALADIASGAAGMVIGTHALFQEQVEFKNLALVVIDEQHRFGVGQRMALSAKGNAPHVLHMTATPIPRSLTMTLYGDMDGSTLREKPAGRQPIATRIIPLSRYGGLMERLQSALDRGEKAYWICPLIDDSATGMPESGRDDLAAAQSRYTEFAARFGERVGLVHGRMRATERDEQMRRFAAGETRLLVATTVVEVGVDVRDATIMVIEQAERFGLSQLHQLRGRVGRGDKPSSCVLLYSDRVKEEDDLALRRLSILRETEDGFRIAEADLDMRGGGDLLGARQSGLPRFIFTDLLRHGPLLEQARREARRLLEADPLLSSGRGQALRILLQLFGFEVGGMDNDY